MLSREEIEKVKKIEQGKKMEIVVINNGFILKIRTGWYSYKTVEELTKAVSDYAQVVQRELK